MPGGGPETGGDQQGADLVAVQSGGMGLVVKPWAADMHRRRVLQQLFLDGVPVEPADRAQPAGDRRPGPSAVLQFPAVAFDSARRTANSRSPCDSHQAN